MRAPSSTEVPPHVAPEVMEVEPLRPRRGGRLKDRRNRRACRRSPRLACRNRMLPVSILAGHIEPPFLE